MAVFTMVFKKHVDTRMGLRRIRDPICVLIVLKAAGTLTLMLYALWWKAGNLVDLPDKRIGFYNFCLWNETARELQCLKSKHLQVMGINLMGMGLATVCVYACLVFNIFYLFFMILVRGTEEREGWKLILIILVIKVAMLSGGLGSFLLQTSQWIHPSDFTGGFFALLGTQALLLLQILIITVYLSWANYTQQCQRSFTEKALPVVI
ncbi:PREDICTED: transmembrane protein 140 [Calidris pugnax]|uniref:transmembrane protein 140 n=1 Tax=Calidris pugnax TaxID=198806 RepID=UPI00071E3CDD|nr:PREDICTED: transmembrane protein 140 [Calidris pugnax]XP_014818943.1 PREDICTED: transmembrane protein 140 [Calidris pugnax]